MSGNGPADETALREAFKAGWKERDRNPGLKRVMRRSLDNAIRSAIGGGRFNDHDYVPDHRTYHGSIWLNSAFRKSLATSTAKDGGSK